MTDRIFFCRRITAETIFFMLIMSSLCYAENVKGGISDDVGPVKGATVRVYLSYDDLVTEKTFSESMPTDLDGKYELDVPEGEYYFTAQAYKDGKKYFAYRGNNPIHINKENNWIPLIVNEAKPPVYKQGNVSLTGQVTYKGQPVKKAWLSFYAMEHKSFKGVGSLSQQVDDDGKFSIKWLPPGKYVLIARKTEDDNKRRPLKKGDLFCYYGGNPIEIIEGKTLQIELPCYVRGPGGTSPKTAKIKKGENEVTGNLLEKNEPGIKGKVTNGDGKPVENIYVIAFKSGKNNAATPNGSAGDKYIGITDTEGNYFIPIDSEGDFRIVARDSLGGSPDERSMFGTYSGNPIQTISFKRGQIIEGVNIVITQATSKKKQ